MGNKTDQKKVCIKVKRTKTVFEKVLIRLKIYVPYVVTCFHYFYYLSAVLFPFILFSAAFFRSFGELLMHNVKQFSIDIFVSVVAFLQCFIQSNRVCQRSIHRVYLQKNTVDGVRIGFENHSCLDIFEKMLN